MAVKNSKRRGRFLGKGGDDWRDPESRRDPYPPRMSQCISMLGACCKFCDKWFNYASDNYQKYCSGACYQADKRAKRKENKVSIKAYSDPPPKTIHQIIQAINYEIDSRMCGSGKGFTKKELFSLYSVIIRHKNRKGERKGLVLCLE